MTYDHKKLNDVEVNKIAVRLSENVRQLNYKYFWVIVKHRSTENVEEIWQVCVF